MKLGTPVVFATKAAELYRKRIECYKGRGYSIISDNIDNLSFVLGKVLEKED